MSLKDKFREWISDNLRYLLLILGILVVVLVLYFGIGAFIKDKKESSGELFQKEEQDNKKTPIANNNSASSSDQSKEDTQDLKKDGNPEILDLMKRYYDALGRKDTDTLKTLVDNLSMEDQESISQETRIEGYEDIETYTFTGQEEGTFVVITRYNSKYKDIDTRAPGLTGQYVYTDKDGKLVIAADVEDEDIKTYLDDIQSRPDVKQLIDETQAAYDEARSQDKKLDELISSVLE